MRTISNSQSFRRFIFKQNKLKVEFYPFCFVFRIDMSNYDGSCKRSVMESRLNTQPFSIVYIKGDLYWTDVANNKLLVTKVASGFTEIFQYLPQISLKIDYYGITEDSGKKLCSKHHVHLRRFRGIYRIFTRKLIPCAKYLKFASGFARNIQNLADFVDSVLRDDRKSNFIYARHESDQHHFKFYTSPFSLLLKQTTSSTLRILSSSFFFCKI